MDANTLRQGQVGVSKNASFFLIRARSHRREKRACMKVAQPTLTCQAHVTFPPRFIRYFRWKPCQVGTLPPGKTLYRKYQIECGRQKLGTTSRSVFLSFLTLSRGTIGDGKKYGSGSSSLEQFFFFCDRCRDLAAALRRVPRTTALALSKHRADSCQEANGHFFSRRESLLLTVSGCTGMTDWEFCESHQEVKLIGSGGIISRYSLTLVWELRSRHILLKKKRKTESRDLSPLSPSSQPQIDRVSQNVALKLVTKPIPLNRPSGLSD